MGSNTMFSKVITVRMAALVVFLLLWAPANRVAFGQAELSGSWAARNHEILAGDGFPVDYTTHMKAGFLRKTGPPSSDQAAMTTRFLRHGDILTVLAVIEDPIYLAEPWILSKSYQLSATPLSPVGPPCVTTYEGGTGES